MTDDHPYAALPQVQQFEVTSTDLTDGAPMAEDQRGADWGGNRSPQLSWSGFPDTTRSFVVNVFDPDAPIPGGWWHWSVANIPADVTSLATDAGRPDGSGLPAGAIQLRNDAGLVGYRGAAPPPGHGPHRYVLTVHAVDVDRLEVDETTTPAKLAFLLFGHTVGRAHLTTTAER
jgi:Raf kinase inhibitor-like YbhB/YbcL family protein